MVFAYKLSAGVFWEIPEEAKYKDCKYGEKHIRSLCLIFVCEKIVKESTFHTLQRSEEIDGRYKNNILGIKG